MKITDAQIKAAYQVARLVYAGQMSLRDGASELNATYGLNVNSARDFIEDYKALLHGKLFQRAMSAPAMEYFLANIEKEHGSVALAASLDALRKHITYYENVRQVNLHKMRGVVAKFSQRIEQPLDFEQLQMDFAQAMEIFKTLTPDEKSRKLGASPKLPVRSKAIVSVYLRNPYVVAAVLERAKGKCERCHKPAPFLRGKDGTPYLEVHHKIRLADRGEDTVDNAIALCPNCHRELHHGPQGAHQGTSSDVLD
jgi:5-methylcytosine-specific restriction protein A